MNSKNKTIISCIIPAYNEEKNIENVLKVITTYKKFDEIIIMDDCSKDNTKLVCEKFAKKDSRITVITNKKNLGKTHNVIKGIEKSLGKIIVLIDADLINLTKKNITSLITPVITNKYDLTILDRAGDRTPMWGWTNCARFEGGERAFFKKDFLKIDFKDAPGYLLEIVMNVHYMNQKKRILTIYCKNLDTVHQYDKINKIEGYKNYIKMSKNILKKAGLLKYLEQIIKIEEDRLKKIYKISNKKYYNIVGIPSVITLGFLLGLYTFVELNIIKQKNNLSKHNKKSNSSNYRYYYQKINEMYLKLLKIKQIPKIIKNTSIRTLNKFKK